MCGPSEEIAVRDPTTKESVKSRWLAKCHCPIKDRTTLTTSRASLISTNSSVDAHTSRKRTLAASSKALASAELRIVKRRTTSLPYRVRDLEGGERSRDGSFINAERSDGSLRIPQIVSMTISLKRIHGRRGSREWARSWTGSRGGGGVTLEPAGTAGARLASSRLHRKTKTQWSRCILCCQQRWHRRGAGIEEGCSGCRAMLLVCSQHPAHRCRIL